MSDDTALLDPLPSQQELEKSKTSTELREMLMTRQKQQGIWESEVASAMAILRVQKNVGMTESLIDAEGFPRDDVDVTAVRAARNTIATRTNDLKNLGEELKILLEAVFAVIAKEQGQEHSPEEQNEMRFEQKRRERLEAKEKALRSEDSAEGNATHHPPKISAEKKKQEELNSIWGNLEEVGVVPFAIVRDVKLNSPAFHAGLLDGDILVAVGKDSGKDEVLKPDDTIQPMLTLKDFANLITKSNGVPLCLILQREEKDGKTQKKTGTKILQEIHLVPTTWSGAGTLGCGLDPV